MQIRRNVGQADRIVRLITGLSLMLFAAAGLFPGVWRLIMPVIGLVVLVTGAVGFCPLYRLLRLDGARP